MVKSLSRIFFVFCFIIISKSIFSQSQYDNIRLINRVNKYPISNAYAFFFKNGKVVFRDESDYDGYLKSPSQASYDSVLISGVEIKPIKFNNNEVSGILFIESKSELELKQILVTGQILPGSKFNSPFSAKVISSEDIKQKGASNLAEALRSENSIRIVQDPVLGAKLTMLGMQPQDIKILIDGVPVIGKQNGSIDISQLNLANVEKIEAVEGALSVIYGPNATGGVINIVTKRKQQEKWSLGLNSHNESVGQFNQNVNLGLNIKKHMINLSLGRTVFLGWDPNQDSFKFLPKTQTRDYLWNQKEQYFGNLSYAIQLKKSHSIRVKLDAFTERILNRLNPISAYSNYGLDDWYHTKRYNMGVSYNGRINHDINIESNASYMLYHRIFEQNYKQLDNGNLFSLQTTNDYINTLFNRTWISYSKEKSKVKLLAGYEFNMDRAQGVRILDTVKTLYDLGILTSLTYSPFTSLLLQPGIRFTFNSKYFTPIAPSFNIKFNPSKSFNMRFLISRAFVSPDIKELYFEFKDFNHNIIGNENLAVESSTNLQLGFEVKKQKAEKEKYSYNSTLNINFSDKKDAIELVLIKKNLQEFQYKNIGKTRILSIAYNMNINFGNVKSTLGAALIGNNKNFDQIINPKKDVYYGTTEVNTSLSYFEKNSKLNLSLYYKYVGYSAFTSINQATQQLELTSQSPYQIFDITLSRSFFKEKVFLNIGCKNLLDVVNIVQNGSGGNFHNSGSSQPMLWGRSFFIDLKIDLKQATKTNVND